MIDINELRRLAQAASHPTTKGRWMRLFGERTVYDRMEDGCRGIPVVSTDKHPPGLFEAACLDFIAAANPAAISELLDRLESAESEALEEARLNGMGSERETALIAKLEVAEKERDALRAKIEEMEKQEPVAWMLNCPTLGGDTGWILSWTQSGAGQCNRLSGEENEKKLYTLPGAQPAPSIPEGWKPIPEKHPTFDLVDLRLADGSVLCGCVPQSDGDYWWEGPSGEVFIDPKYAPVTHWRLAAAPEAKP